MKVGDELSPKDVKEFGKTDPRYFEERRVVVREIEDDHLDGFSEKEIIDNFGEEVGEEVSENKGPAVRESLFSLISNLFSNFANFLFSEEITGNVVEERIIDEPFEKLD
jgi:hypothetical protein